MWHELRVGGREMHAGFWWGKPEGKRLLGRLRLRWENIKLNCKETGWERVEWIDLARDRDKWRAVVNTVMNLQVPQYC